MTISVAPVRAGTSATNPTTCAENAVRSWMKSAGMLFAGGADLDVRLAEFEACYGKDPNGRAKRHSRVLERIEQLKLHLD